MRNQIPKLIELRCKRCGHKLCEFMGGSDVSIGFKCCSCKRIVVLTRLQDAEVYSKASNGSYYV